MSSLRLLPILFLVFMFFITVGNASSTLSISVETSKPSYSMGEPIIVYGILKSGDSPVQDGLVAFEIQDPTSSSLITLTLQTDVNGVYNVTFELSEKALFGTYDVYVSSTYENETATNSTTFSLNQFIITVETDKSSYRVGESVYVSGKLVLNNATVQGGLVAFEVQDPEHNSIMVVTLQTDSTGTYDTTFKLASDSKLGNYTIYVSSQVHDARGVNSTSFEALQKTLSTDINGDGVVNILDIAIVTKAYGSYPGHPRWNPVADLDSSGMVNILDIARVAKDYGKTL